MKREKKLMEAKYEEEWNPLDNDTIIVPVCVLDMGFK